jgi:hypothetical protein
VELTTTIYFIGYTVSLVALLFAVYIFWKFKDLRCLRNTIHMNLMCSYILADFMWIFVYSLQVCVNHPGLLTPNKQDLIGGNLPNSWTKIETHYRKTNIWRANSDILHFAALAPIFCLKSTRICAVHF